MLRRCASVVSAASSALRGRVSRLQNQPRRHEQWQGPSAVVFVVVFILSPVFFCCCLIQTICLPITATSSWQDCSSVAARDFSRSISSSAAGQRSNRLALRAFANPSPLACATRPGCCPARRFAATDRHRSGSESRCRLASIFDAEIAVVVGVVVTLPNVLSLKGGEPFQLDSLRFICVSIGIDYFLFKRNQVQLHLSGLHCCGRLMCFTTLFSEKPAFATESFFFLLQRRSLCAFVYVPDGIPDANHLSSSVSVGVNKPRDSVFTMDLFIQFLIIQFRILRPELCFHFLICFVAVFP